VTTRVSVVKSQRRLLIVWASLGGLGLIIVLIQTSPSGAYHSNASDVWEWFLPTVVPTVSLILGTLVAQARTPEPDATVELFYYRLAVWSSAVYLALVVTLLLMYAQSPTPVADLKSTSRLVTALYGVVGIALGTFFVSKKSADK
jgi:hypothetical protein